MTLKIEDIHVGMELMGPDGKVGKVEGVFIPRDNRKPHVTLDYRVGADLLSSCSLPKPMGQVAYEKSLWLNLPTWASLNTNTRDHWEKVAQAVIDEHERRKGS